MFYQINGILFIAFNFVSCDLLKFDWLEMLNSHQNFSSNILSFRMTVVSAETSKNEAVLNKTWISTNSLYFIT